LSFTALNFLALLKCMPKLSLAKCQVMRLVVAEKTQ